MLGLCLLVLMPVDDPKMPKELTELTGTFSGTWTMSGINEKGEVVPRMKWDDVITISKPTLEKDRIVVNVIYEMKFIEPKYPTRKTTFKEGFFLKGDGSLGEYFIDMNGSIIRMIRLAEDVWTYTAEASSQELGMLGFPAGSTGKHVLVKVITRDGEKMAHRITRVSTVKYKDKTGQTKTLQYVSMQGVHER